MLKARAKSPVTKPTGPVTVDLCECGCVCVYMKLKLAWRPAHHSHPGSTVIQLGWLRASEADETQVP